jgi:hypothetical protein
VVAGLIAGLVAVVALMAMLAWALTSLDGGGSPSATPPPPAPASTSPSPATIAVPQVAGQKLDDAIKALTAAGLSIKQVTQVPDGHHDRVVSTTPPGGAQVAPGSAVTVYVGSGPGGPGPGGPGDGGPGNAGPGNGGPGNGHDDGNGPGGEGG